MWDKMETPTIVYDLDTSGGLMQQIQALLAPPKSEDGEKRSRKPDKNARRSGRATNHDTCDSCREGGDLLCCDHCPAAFHLQCCNPPLSKEMLPPGDWMCHRCTVRRKKRELKKEQINGLVERQLSKQSPSHAAEVEMTPGTIRLDPHATVSTGLRAAVAQVRLMERRPSSRPNTPTSTASTDTPTPSEQNDMDEDMLDVEDEAQCSDPESSTPHLKRPFDLLIAAAMERNPTQFQLPNELTCTTALPGTSKKRRRDEMTGKNVKRPQHELDHNGLVPLPVRVCYTCGRSCRLAPLIQCDYCPLLFHMDCLDPPLTAMPVGKWMCPNHIEHAVLKQRSLTLSSRCQLFDQFQDRMSQHAVKVDFLQRVHRLHPPLPRGSYTHQKKTLKVPDAIKCQYKSPPLMIPPAGIRYGELICSSIPEPSPTWHLPAYRHLTSEEEQQEWLRDVITLQCSIMKHLSDRKTPSSKCAAPLTDLADVKPSVTAQDSTVCSSNRKEASVSEVRPASCGEHQSSSSPVCCLCRKTQCHCGPSNGPLSQHTRTKSSEEQGKLRLTEDSSGLPCLQTSAFSAPLLNHVVVVKAEGATSKTLATMASQIKSELAIPQAAHSTSPNAGSQGHDLGLTGSGLISPNPSHQIRLASSSLPTSVLTEEKAGVSGVTSSSSLQLPSVLPSTMGDMASCLKALTDCNGEIQLSNLDETFIKLLAWQRVQQLLGSKAPSPQSSASSNPLTPGQGPLAQAAPSKEIQARAVFYPLNGNVSVNMCYRSLNIGTGADMDVCLTNYGHCNYVSGKHACIFYDENTKQYELLNYSEHGTTVDNVLYSCDFSAKTGPSPAGNLVSKVQNIIKRCKKRKREEEGLGDTALPQEGVMSQSQAPAPTPCDCKASSSSLIGGSGAGWEGTALLHHGSFIKLGCMQFVFSITEFASKQLKEESQPTSTPTPSVSTAAPQVEEIPEPSEKHSPHLYKVPVLQPSLVPQSGSPSVPY